jgi:dUTP pyrophosphatase
MYLWGFIHLTSSVPWLSLSFSEVIMSDIVSLKNDVVVEGTWLPVFRFAINDGLDASFLPTRGTEKATGWDVHCAEETVIRPFQHAKIPLGFRVLTPAGWWLELRPRSSSFAKKNLHSLYGVIDEDYEGQVIFACQYIPEMAGMGQDLIIQAGEAVGQLVPYKRQEMLVEKVSAEQYAELVKARQYTRGTGGFGSTSK